MGWRGRRGKQDSELGVKCGEGQEGDEECTRLCDGERWQGTITQGPILVEGRGSHDAFALRLENNPVLKTTQLSAGL